MVSTLVSQVAADYFQLLELDYELEISQQHAGDAPRVSTTVEERQGGGVATLLDLRQAEELVSSAAESIPRFSSRSNRRRTGFRCCWGGIPEA